MHSVSSLILPKMLTKKQGLPLHREISPIHPTKTKPIISRMLVAMSIALCLQHLATATATDYTVRGEACGTPCQRYGYRYTHCQTWFSWDYCTTSSNTTVYGYPCLSHCDNRGSSYSWCRSAPRGLSLRRWSYCTKEIYLVKTTTVTTTTTTTTTTTATTTECHAAFCFSKTSSSSTYLKISGTIIGVATLLVFFFCSGKRLIKLLRPKKNHGAQQVVPVFTRGSDGSEVRVGTTAVLAENGATNKKDGDEWGIVIIAFATQLITLIC